MGLRQKLTMYELGSSHVLDLNNQHIVCSFEVTMAHSIIKVPSDELIYHADIQLACSIKINP